MPCLLPACKSETRLWTSARSCQWQPGSHAWAQAVETQGLVLFIKLQGMLDPAFTLRMQHAARRAPGTRAADLSIIWRRA